MRLCGAVVNRCVKGSAMAVFVFPLAGGPLLIDTPNGTNVCRNIHPAVGLLYLKHQMQQQKLPLLKCFANLDFEDSFCKSPCCGVHFYLVL